jgi:hypothetical protein
MGEWSQGNLMERPQADAFEPEMIALMRAALDEAWSTLPFERQARTSKSELAERILKLAARGERDPVRLRTRAVIELVSGIPAP